MNTKLQLVKAQVKNLYETAPNVHLSMSVNYSKVHFRKTSAAITGVYPNIFTVEVNTSGKKEHLNIQYVDIITGVVDIAELKIG